LILITCEPLDHEAIISTVRRDSNGGVVTFMGTTRKETNGRRVLYLEYESYDKMAEKMLGFIADEIRERWGITDLSIAHRFGRLEVGETSLVIAVGAPHRDEAFAACRYAVERIKENVPIWKKEVFDDGEVWVGIKDQQA
jgi:molybdopterin synthase catalytic subunit